MAQARGWPYEPVDVAPPPAPPATAPRPVEPEPTLLPPPSLPPAEADGVAPSRASVVALAVACALASMLAAAGITDWLVRNREMDTLLHRIEQSEAAQRPYQAVARQELFLCQRAEPCDLDRISAAAASALVAERRAGEAVADTRVARTHTGIRRLRDAYFAHNQAWQAHLERVSRNPLAALEPAEDIETTWEEAVAAARPALPPFPLHDAPARVERLFPAY